MNEGRKEGAKAGGNRSRRKEQRYEGRKAAAINDCKAKAVVALVFLLMCIVCVMCRPMYVHFRQLSDLTVCFIALHEIRYNSNTVIEGVS